MSPPATPPAVIAPATEQPASEARDAAPNAVFVELLGNGLLYSIDYERMFPRWNVGLRAGASYFAWTVSRADGSGALKLASFPVVASWYVGPPRHKLQLGLGATVLYFAASTDSTGIKFEGAVDGLGVAATGVVGYRYIPRDGGFTFGAGFTPLLRASKGFLPWGGANVGFAF